MIEVANIDMRSSTATPGANVGPPLPVEPNHAQRRAELLAIERATRGMKRVKLRLSGLPPAGLSSHAAKRAKARAEAAQ